MDVVYYGHVGMPKKVQMAVFLLFADIGISVLNCFLSIPHLPLSNKSSEFVLAFVILMIAVFVFHGFLAYMTWLGKNWARITILVLFILAILSGLHRIPSFWQSFTDSPLSGILKITGYILTLTAIILLFQRQSSDWFHFMAARRQTRYYNHY